MISVRDLRDVFNNNFLSYYNKAYLHGLNALAILFFNINPLNNKFTILVARKGGGKSTLIKSLNIDNFINLDYDSKYQEQLIFGLLNALSDKQKERAQRYLPDELKDDIRAIAKKIIELDSRIYLDKNVLIKIHEYNKIESSIPNILGTFISFIEDRNSVFYSKRIGLPIQFIFDEASYINSILGIQEVFIDELKGEQYDYFYSDRVLVNTLFTFLMDITPPIKEEKIPFTFKINDFFDDLKSVKVQRIRRDIEKELYYLSTSLIEYAINRRPLILYNAYKMLLYYLGDEDLALKFIKALYPFIEFYYKSISYKGIRETTKIIDRTFIMVSTYISHIVEPLSVLSTKRGLRNYFELINSRSALYYELRSLKRGGFDIIRLYKGPHFLDYAIKINKFFYPPMKLIINDTNLVKLIENFDSPKFRNETLLEITKMHMFKIIKEIENYACE